jgi:hypothetical protein
MDEGDAQATDDRGVRGLRIIKEMIKHAIEVFASE